MKVNLLSSADVLSLKLPFNEVCRPKFKIILNPGTNLTSAEETVFKEFTSAFQNIERLDKDILVVSIGRSPTNKNDGQRLETLVQGPGIDLIHGIVNFRNPKGALNLKLILTLSNANEQDGRDSTIVLQMARGELKDPPILNVPSVYYCVKNLDDVLESMEIRVDPYIVKVQVEVDLGDYVPGLRKILQPVDEVTLGILQNKKCTDFNIETSEGSILPCHRAFLIERSKVLAATIEGDFKEANEGRLLMSDLSTNSAVAFLEFVYSNTVGAAITNCKVAFELLKAADYYDMPVLWSAITEIMLVKSTTSTSWFGTELALQIFDFVLKKPEKEGYQELKLKLIQMLAVLLKDPDAYQLFQEMYPTSVPSEFFTSTLSVVKP